MNPESGSWYPSCVIVMTIRFDEALQVGGTGEAVTARGLAAQTQHDRMLGEVSTFGHSGGGGKRTLKGKKHRPRRALNEQAETDRRFNNKQLSDLDDFGSQPSSSFAVPDSTSAASGGGRQPVEPGRGTLVPITFGTDGYTVIANRVPSRGTFVLPHPRTAGTFNLSFDYQEFPVDPRLLRAVGIEVHIGAVSADDYARGMAGDKDSDGRPLSILKTTSSLVDPWSGRPAPNNQTLLFYATCDTWEVDLDDKRSVITLEGRDVRGIFLDAKVPTARAAKVDTTKPIDRVIADLIKTMGLEHDLRMTIMTDAAEWPGGKVPSPGDAEGLTRVRLSAGGDQTRSTPATASKTTYWDLITNYCTLVGAMPVFVGSTLWIRPNQRIFDVLDKRRHTRTAFAGGVPRQVNGEQIRVRRMIYGRDLTRLRFQRKFAGAVVPTVQCLSYDDRGTGLARLIFGQWPPDATPQAQAKAETELLRVPIWGVRSVDQLTEIAHGIYEEVGRGETGGSGATANLASYGGTNVDPDVLRLRPLDPVEFLVDAQALTTVAPVVSEVADAGRRTFSEEVDVLARRLGDRAVARALVALARGAVRELLAFYQVIGVQYDWDNGLRTSFTFQNYIVPRHYAGSTKAAGAISGQPRRTDIDVVGAQRKARLVPEGGQLTYYHNQQEAFDDLLTDAHVYNGQDAFNRFADPDGTGQRFRTVGLPHEQTPGEQLLDAFNPLKGL